MGVQKAHRVACQCQCRAAVSSVSVPFLDIDGRTLSPDKTTCLASSIELYWEDFKHLTTRLHFRVRCSSRLALAWLCLMPSEVPKMVAMPKIVERAMVHTMIQSLLHHAPFAFSYRHPFCIWSGYPVQKRPLAKFPRKVLQCDLWTCAHKVDAKSQ